MNAFVSLINKRNRQYFEREEKENQMRQQIHQRLSWTSEQALKQFSSSDNDNDNVTRHRPESLRPRVHVFCTFFFARLEQGGYDYDGVRRWLRRAGHSIADLDLILIPVNLSNFHWVLGAIDLRNHKFAYLDSMLKGDSFKVIDRLQRWLHDEVNDKLGKRMAQRANIMKWTTLCNPQWLPDQHDGRPCGVFTLYFAEYLERAVKPDFSQYDIMYMRQRTMLFLKNAQLPE